jgi:very-short-patch-repair endonuclease
VTDRFGEFVARTDFILDEYKLVLEYQGDYHRSTKGQWRADMTRRSKLEAEGWRVMELNADDLKDPIELVTRMRKLARLRG